MTLQEKFPCDFQIKIIGNNNTRFTRQVNNIVKKYFGLKSQGYKIIRKQKSKNANYLALSVLLYQVENQAALDALYSELSSHPEIKWVL